MDSTCFRLHQLEAITNNFSEDQKVGSGGYGAVYKAVHNGEEIAVKKLHPLIDLDNKDFHIELRILNKAHHKNIVRLIGYCHETHQRCMEHNGDLVFAKMLERLLCFQYMQGGSLDKHIGDFGLSTCVASTEEYRTEIMKGTFGYMPPEYVDNRIVSSKFDVFSLGVIIMRMMAGNKVDFRHSEMSPGHLIELVNENWKRRFQATLEYPSHDIDILRVRTCVKIALRCVDVDREKRPCIDGIVRGLEELEADIKRILSLPPDESKDLILQVASKPFHMSSQATTSTAQHLTLQYLKDITNNFCNELGRGSFGVVYKGVLENGKSVAVKKLIRLIPSSQDQFENEVNLLMKLKHPNIVRLVGYCYETQHLHTPHEGKSVFAWNTERLLCLECLPNGSLDKYISDASSGLDWHTRCKIIEGISYGLQYLHEQSNDPIVHLDLKPANILLDQNMLPKITDFGLSRLFDQSQTIETAVTSGTLGYMPPEFLRGIITPMSDIFSLGVIIMEVITGHRDYPYDIKKSSRGFIELELGKWRDRLQKEPSYTSLETDCQQIERCIQIGLICVNLDRTERPTMKKIIHMLQGLETMNWYISNELSSHGIQEEP